MVRFYIDKIVHNNNDIYVLKNTREGHEHCLLTVTALTALTKSKRISKKTRNFISKAIEMIKSKQQGNVK